MIEIETATIRLGERDFTIQTAGFLRSRPWKKRLLEEIKPLFEQIGAAKDMQFNSPADLLELLPLGESLLIEGVDKVFELLIAYSPELEAARPYIEAHSTDKQILAAFQEVVKLADPFGMIHQFNRRIGREMTGMLSNSQSANGG